MTCSVKNILGLCALFIFCFIGCSEKQNLIQIKSDQGQASSAAEIVKCEPVTRPPLPVILRDIAIIDGLGNPVRNNQVVLINNGHIRYVGDVDTQPNIDGFEDASVIDGNGLTVMPGLVDLHVHIGNKTISDGVKSYDRQQGLNAFLYAGVTTVLDLGSKHDEVIEARDAINDRCMRGPEIIAAGQTVQRLKNVTSVFSLTSDEVKAEITALLDQRQEAGIDIVKVYAGMSNWSARHLVNEAQKRDMQVIADFWCTNLSRTVFEVTEVDAYAHGGCRELTDEEAQWMADNNKYAMMTLTIFDLFGGHRVYADLETKGFLNDPLVVDVLPDLARQHYSRFEEGREKIFEGKRALYPMQLFGDLKDHLSDNQINVKKLYDAGVLIGIGTDAPFLPGNFPGESMHHEMALHVEAGIPPLNVIEMATHIAAKILRRDDTHGSVEVGKVADLLIVRGNPSKNINDTREIAYVIQDGEIIDRASLRPQ